MKKFFIKNEENEFVELTEGTVINAKFVKNEDNRFFSNTCIYTFNGDENYPTTKKLIKEGIIQVREVDEDENNDYDISDYEHLLAKMVDEHCDMDKRIEQLEEDISMIAEDMRGLIKVVKGLVNENKPIKKIS